MVLAGRLVLMRNTPLPQSIVPVASAFRRLAAGIAEYALLVACVFFLCVLLVSINPIDPVAHSVGIAQYVGLSDVKKQALQEYWLYGLSFFDIARLKLEALLQGNWGSSKIFDTDVVSLIAERLPFSLWLVFPAWLLSGGVGVTLGVVSAYRPQSLLSKGLMQLAFLLSSIPLFCVSLVLLFAFAVVLPLFPLGFAAPVGTSISDADIAVRIHHMVLPLFVLVLGGIPQVLIHTRTRALEIMEAPFMLFAQKNGMTRMRALRQFGLKHMIAPGASILCAQVGSLVGQAIVVEEVFSYPGLGNALLEAALQSDFDLLFALSVLATSLVFVASKAQGIVRLLESPQGQRRLRRACARLAPWRAELQCARARKKAKNLLLSRQAKCTSSSFASAVRVHIADARTPLLRTASSARAAALRMRRALHMPASCVRVRQHALKQENRVRARSTVTYSAVVLLCLACIVASFFLEGAASQVNFALKNLPPSLDHPFGTDFLGRDLFARSMLGLRISSGMALLATAFALMCAAMAALVQVRASFPIVSRLVILLENVFLSIPQLVLLMLLALVAGRGMLGLVVALALSHWPTMARILTGELSTVVESSYLARAYWAGVRPLRIITTHYIPSLVPQLSAGALMIFPHVMVHEATLSFLGLGLSLETPSLGIIIHESLKTFAAGYWWEFLFPSLCILLAILGMYSALQLYNQQMGIRK